MELHDKALNSALIDHATLNGVAPLLIAVLRIEARFNIEYETEGESYYDSDDRLVIPYEAVQKDIDVGLTFPIRVELKITPASEVEFGTVTMQLAEQVEILPVDDHEIAIQTDS